MRSLALALALGVSSASAQTPAYPVKALRFIAGFPAGGPSDIVTRAVANDISTWFGVVAPAGTAPDVVARLNATLVTIVGETETHRFLVAQGLEPATSTPQELGRIIEGEIPKFAQIVRTAGIKPE